MPLGFFILVLSGYRSTELTNRTINTVQYGYTVQVSDTTMLNSSTNAGNKIKKSTWLLILVSSILW